MRLITGLYAPIGRKFQGYFLGGGYHNFAYIWAQIL